MKCDELVISKTYFTWLYWVHLFW